MFWLSLALEGFNLTFITFIGIVLILVCFLKGFIRIGLYCYHLMQAIALDQGTISTLRGPNLSNTWEVLIPTSEQGFIVFSEPMEKISCQGNNSFFSQMLAPKKVAQDNSSSINSINQHNKEAQVQKSNDPTIPDVSLRNHLHCIIRVSQLNCYNMGESSHLHMVPSLGSPSDSRKLISMV